MDNGRDRGDGRHIGGNRPIFPLFFPPGPRPPTEERNGALLAWIAYFEDLERRHRRHVFWENLREEEEGNANADNDNDQNQDNNDNQVENNDNIVNNDNNGNHDDLDNNDDHNADVNVENADSLSVNNNIDNAEDAGPSAGLEVGTNQGLEEDNPPPGTSRKRSREEDDQDKFRCWDVFADSSSDSDTDSTISQDFKRARGPSPVEHAEVAEEDPVPGPSRKRLRKSSRPEERSSKRARWCDEFADCNSDTVTSTTGHDFADSSDRVNAKDAGVAKETDDEEDKQVDKEEDPRPRTRKKSRQDDEEEENNKRCKH